MEKSWSDILSTSTSRRTVNYWINIFSILITNFMFGKLYSVKKKKNLFLIKWWIIVKNIITCNIVIETSLCMSLVYISFSESFHVVVAMPNATSLIIIIMH